MTTRRRRPAGPPPPRGRSGRFGLFPPLAMQLLSVKTLQCGVDPDTLFEHAGELLPLDRSLEARHVAARVRTAARFVPASDEDAVARREPEQNTLRTAPAAAGARPQRIPSYDSSSAATSATSSPASTSSEPSA